MEITDEDKALIADHLARGEPLPDRYRFTLFREPREAELIWPGKTHDVTRAVLPFQSIEQIDEPRAETGAQVGDLFSLDAGGRQVGGWSNKLIWGDNKLVLSSLAGGPLRKAIEDAGGLKLVYIDPPFDVGADFGFDVEIGGEEFRREPTVIEDIAYRDTWGRGTDSFAGMIYERLSLIRSLLADDGSLYVHCDYRVTAIIRSILDELFGPSNHLNEVIWSFNTRTMSSDWFARKHNTIHFYRKSSHYFNTDAVRVEHRPDSLVQYDKVDELGRRYKQQSHGARTYLNELGQPCPDVWDLQILGSRDRERNGYATQKPETLIERVLTASSRPGDLVADFFSGSGTTLAVAEKLGRKWIGCDLGRFAIHTSRKRLIGVQRQLKAEGKPYRAFEILNLGKYERQWFAGIDPTLPPEQRAVVAANKEAAYVELILRAYAAQPAEQSPPFHGRKGDAFVLVGPVDAPVTESQVSEAINAARMLNARAVDVLGFEFEMGLSPRLPDEARAKGVQLSLRYIPKDVFDARAIAKGQVSFHDLAYVEAKAVVTSKRDRTVSVSLTDFGVFYRQEDLEALTADMRPGSKVTVDKGQVVKVTKAKSGEVTEEVLTKNWTDWIDYWAVDFDYASRPETIYETVIRADGSTQHVPQWTGNYIFENEWQSFRTRRDRKLELTSAPHQYSAAGRYRVAVKVIDIFGNDTTKVIGVEI